MKNGRYRELHFGRTKKNGVFLLLPEMEQVMALELVLAKALQVLVLVPLSGF